jgi:hypothetical protein
MENCHAEYDKQLASKAVNVTFRPPGQRAERILTTLGAD